MIEYVGTPLRSSDIMGYQELSRYLSLTLAIIISLLAGGLAGEISEMPGGTAAFWLLKDSHRLSSACSSPHL
jgi:hypothetical protein